MVTLFEQNIKTENRQSSKGNQLKWCDGNIWYKADYTGYEGLVEYVVSGLLERSTLFSGAYVKYNTEKIYYSHRDFLGCKSTDFIPEGYNLITLERLFKNFTGESLQKSLVLIGEHEERMRFFLDQVIRITGLESFGKYLSVLLTIDAVFLNEDRHMHNIAVLMDGEGHFQYCPIFDNGAALLSDTTIDYPMSGEIGKMIPTVHSKTICSDFDEQLEIIEQLCGNHIRFDFSEKDIIDLLKKELYYSDEIKKRVFEILMWQCRKYQYLF